MVQKPAHIPKTPGIYIFKDAKGTPLYVGKAGNLKQRLAFYFSASPKPPRTQKLLIEARALEITEVESEVEALVTEAERIKRHMPKYNVLMRDDKNYSYVAVTNERFPRIFITHQPRRPRIKNKEHGIISGNRSRAAKFRIHDSEFIGPFTDAGSLKIVLRMLRRVFPYCTCTQPHTRPCLNAEIGKCPGFCCYDKTKSEIRDTRSGTHSRSKIQNAKYLKEYRKNIQSIVAVLRGRGRTMIKDLRREMKKAAAAEEFERAAVARDQLLGLESIFGHTHIIARPFRDIRARRLPDMERQLQQLLGFSGPIGRIEGYDISNISGTEAVGSMVVATKRSGTPLAGAEAFIHYAANRKEYRHFRIRTVLGANDVAMHAEVLARRFRHHEWPSPDIIVIDGGLPQLHAAMEAIAKNHSVAGENEGKPVSDTFHKRPLITALAKRKEELYIEGRAEPIELQKQPEDILHLFQRIRDESHRFAKRYHHKRREMLYRRA